MTEVTAKSGLLSRIKLHVDDTGGPGRPVVLIHGWPLSGASWDDQVADLAGAGLRVIRYDRRGFGQSDKPKSGYDYDSLADDLDKVLDELELTDVSLVGFSMGGGEVARYISRHGQDRLRSVVFAAAVTPYMAKNEDNPDGPLTSELAGQLKQGLEDDRDAFFEEFSTGFFSVDGELKVTEQQRQAAVAMCHQADQRAAVECMQAWGTTDFRPDLANITVPTLVLHGSGDGTVPFEGSGERTHKAIPQSDLVVIDDAPHGLNVSHRAEFNQALIRFLTTG